MAAIAVFCCLFFEVVFRVCAENDFIPVMAGWVRAFRRVRYLRTDKANLTQPATLFFSLNMVACIL